MAPAENGGRRGYTARVEDRLIIGIGARLAVIRRNREREKVGIVVGTRQRAGARARNTVTGAEVISVVARVTRPQRAIQIHAEVFAHLDLPGCRERQKQNSSQYTRPLNPNPHLLPLLNLQSFNLRVLSQSFIQGGAQLVRLLFLKFLPQGIFYVRELECSGQNMFVQADDGISLIKLNETGNLPILQRQQRCDYLRRQLVPRHRFVVAHHHAVVVVGNLLRQQAKPFGIFRGLGLAQSVVGALAHLFQLIWCWFLRRQNRDRLDGKRLGILIAGNILLVICPGFGEGDRGLIVDLGFQRFFNQQRAADLLLQQLPRSLKFFPQQLLILLGIGELFAKIGLGRLQLGGRHG